VRRATTVGFARQAVTLLRARPRTTNTMFGVLEVMLFSGHKALVTSQMHLASVKESYRELCEKNERLEEAYERLKELDRLKSNFLATVSHELRTPLTSIMGYGEMLAEGVAGDLNGEQLEFVETIRTKSEQLLGLIMSLLDLSKLESGTMLLRQAPMQIEPVLGEVISTLKSVNYQGHLTAEFVLTIDRTPLALSSEKRESDMEFTEADLKFIRELGSGLISAADYDRAVEANIEHLKSVGA